MPISLDGDTTIYLSIFKCSSNTHITYEHEHQLKWPKEMGLDINAQKYRRLIIPKNKNCETVDVNGVKAVDQIKIPGVISSSKGNGTTHIDNIIRASSRKLHAFPVLKPRLCKNDLKFVFFMLIRSLLEYCAPLFVNNWRSAT